MVRFVVLVACLVSVGSAVAAQEKKERRQPRVDISVFTGDFDLEEIEIDPNTTGSSPFDTDVTRERTGVRFAFGGEASRGYFQLFAEDFDEFFDTYGIGGGVIGTPRVNGSDASVGFLIPYRAGLSIAAGTEETAGVDELLVYAELQVEVGVGLDWHGLRPSAGIQLSSLGGVDVLDEDLDGDGDDDEATLTGTNFGGFVELYYKHPDFPVYARARAGGGDYDASELAIGVAW